MVWISEYMEYILFIRSIKLSILYKNVIKSKGEGKDESQDIIHTLTI